METALSPAVVVRAWRQRSCEVAHILQVLVQALAPPTAATVDFSPAAMPWKQRARCLRHGGYDPSDHKSGRDRSPASPNGTSRSHPRLRVGRGLSRSGVPRAALPLEKSGREENRRRRRLVMGRVEKG